MSEMNNMPFLRYCCWSIIQVFAIVAFYRNGVSGERVQGCVGSWLSLRCPEMKVINISVVVLGDSGCSGTSCCIKDNDCTQNANAKHTSDVHSRCNGQSNCTVDVIKEKINCGYLGFRAYNDFERITYNCSNDPKKVTTSRTDVAHSTLDITTQSSTTELANDDSRYTTSVNNEQPAEPKQHQNDGEWLGDSFIFLATFMVITIIVIFIVIVIVLVKLRRKTKLRLRHNWTELSRKGNTRNEITDVNENQETSLHQNNSSTSLTSRLHNNTAPATQTSKGSKATNCESANNKTLNYTVPKKLRQDKQKEGACCKIDIMEPVHSSPKVGARAYSPARDLKESQCTGASEELDSNVYWELETETVANLERRNSEEVWNEYDYVALTRQTGLEVDTPFNTALETTATPALKKDFPEEQNEVITSDGTNSPIYETVPSGTPETNGVSEEATLPNWSLATRTISEEDSETGKAIQRENPYCDMRWSHLRFTEDAEFEDSTHTGSSKDDNICGNVETREPVETGCTTLNYIELDCTRRESNGATNEDTMDIPTQKPEQDAHNTLNVASGLKVGSSEKGEREGEVDLKLSENALYIGLQCDGQSSEEWVTSGDGQTVIDNDIYSH